MEITIQYPPRLPIYGWGDTHGNWDFLKAYINSKKISNLIFLQVGDFGIGFKDNDLSRLNELNELLQKTNCYLYAIRGNHDDPFYFGGSFANKWSNIFLLKDYTILEYMGKNILCVGGAISIDRKPRQVEGRIWGKPLWFRKEKFVYNQEIIQQIKKSYNIDVIVTHSSPASFYPYLSSDYPPIVQKFARGDSTLIQELTEERNSFEDLFNDFRYLDSPPKLWIYGHFHYSYEEMIDNTKVKLLGIDEIWDTQLDR
jgi:UDP-2,3-diacylglucosamine pyrophosphatase LpxH